MCVFIIFCCSYSGDPLDQGYFPVGESLNILNTNTNTKLAMNLHFPLPIRTIGDELTLSLAKNSHFSFSLFTLPVSPFKERSLWWR